MVWKTGKQFFCVFFAFFYKGKPRWLTAQRKRAGNEKNKAKVVTPTYLKSSPGCFADLQKESEKERERQRESWDRCKFYWVRPHLLPLLSQCKHLRLVSVSLWAKCSLRRSGSYTAIAMAKGSEVGRRVKLGSVPKFEQRRQEVWRAGSGREIREGKECFGNWVWHRPELCKREKVKESLGCVYLQAENREDLSCVVLWAVGRFSVCFYGFYFSWLTFFFPHASYRFRSRETWDREAEP